MVMSERFMGRGGNIWIICHMVLLSGNRMLPIRCLTERLHCMSIANVDEKQRSPPDVSQSCESAGRFKI